MARLLYRLGRTAYRRWYAFIAVWLIALVAIGFTATAILQADDRRLLHPGHPVGAGRRPPGELFPDAVDAFDQASVTVVVAAPEGERLNDRRTPRASTR